MDFNLRNLIVHKFSPIRQLNCNLGCLYEPNIVYRFFPLLDLNLCHYLPENLMGTSKRLNKDLGVRQW